VARVADPAIIGELALFKGLDQPGLAHVAELLHWRELGAGVSLLLEEQPGEVAYCIVEGTVRIYTTQADGRDVTLAIVGPGELIGELSVLDQQGRSASAVTLEPTATYWMGRVAFQTCVHTMPTVAYNLALILARRLRVADARSARWPRSMPKAASRTPCWAWRGSMGSPS
jgi:CRP-like cAMP-binding protein